MNRQQMIERAQLFRIQNQVLQFMGDTRHFDSITQAKSFVRNSGKTCVAQRPGEQLRAIMDAREDVEIARRAVVAVEELAKAQKLLAEKEAREAAEQAEMERAHGVADPQ